MENDLVSDLSFTLGINKQFDDLFGGRSSDLGVRVFTEFAEVFIDGIDARMKTFSESLEQENFRQFQQMAHQLRGSFRTLGAHSLADRLQKIEDACKLPTPATQLPELQAWHQQIAEAVPQLINDLKSFIRSLQSAS